MTPYRIAPFALQDPAARQLINQLNAELSARYPEEGATHFHLTPQQVSQGRGVFLLATEVDTSRPVGCGAVRLIEPTVAEVKRMYVHPIARGRGLGRELLEAIEKHASDLGASRLVLETGHRQTEALGLYWRAGFTEIARYGEYVDSPVSICMAKELLLEAIAAVE